MTRKLCALAVALTAWMLPAPAADAATYCVSAPPGCTGITPSPDTVAQAITLALDPTTPEDDTIVVDAGTFPANHVDVPANTDGRLSIEGAGPSQTVFTRTPAEAEVRLNDDEAFLSDVGITLPSSGFFTQGLTLTGATAQNVAITDPAGNSGNIGVLMRDGATLLDADIDMPTSGSLGVQSFPTGDVRVVRGTIDACTGVGGNSTGTTRAERVRVTAATPFHSQFGSYTTDGALGIIDPDAACTNNLWGIAVTGDFPAGRALNVVQTTIVGAGQAGSRGVRLRRDSGSDPLLALSRSSLFTGLQQTIESTGAPVSTMKFSASAFAATATSEPGFDGGTFPNVTDPALGFTNAAAGDYSLTHASGLIDRGEHPLPLGFSDVDLDGLDRSVDGKPVVNGTDARPDIGAHEYQPGLPSVSGGVTPASAQTGQALAFSATGSSGDAGESVTYSWSFDDGTAATGAAVTKSFPTAGTHTGTVTATDASGWTATDTVAVTVAAPAAPAPSTVGGQDPPPVGGAGALPSGGPFTVAFATRTAAVDRRRRVGLRLRCPANAPRSCAGRLTLTVVRRGRTVRLGRRSYSIPRGRTATVRVPLSRAGRRLLRGSGRLRVRAAATVTGGRPARATIRVRRSRSA